MTSKKQFRRYIVIAGIVILIDQLTKWLVRSYLESPIPLFPTFVLAHISNTGAGFGILADERLLLSAVAMLVVIWITMLVAREQQTTLSCTALGLISGGALGNLLDRLIQGAVTDFLDFSFFPAFNAADSAITIGALVLVYDAWKRR